MNKNQRKVWQIASLAAIGATVIAEIVLLIQILLLGMLPFEFTLLIILVFLLIPVLMFLGVWKKMKQKKGRKALLRHIIILVVALVMVAGCIVGTVAIAKLRQTLGAVTQPSDEPEAKQTIVGIYVPQGAPAQTLADAKDYVFAYPTVNDTWNVNEAVAALEEKVGQEISTHGCDGALAAIDAVTSGQANALILDVVTAEITESIEGYTSFLYDHRLLEQIAVAALEPAIDPNTTEPEEEEPTVPSTPPVENVAQEPFIVYLSGSDGRSDDLKSNDRSDVNILAVVNPDTHQILLVNTPRDFYVSMPTKRGAKDKLTHCGYYGMDCSMAALGNLYGCSVDYNAKINFTGFETLIDAIGGITIVSDTAFKTDDGYQIKEGVNEMNGAVALSFARERNHVKGGDNTRGQNQMKVITAVINKVTSGTTIITRYTEIMDSLQGMFTTSMGVDKMSDLVQMQLSTMPGWDIKTYAATGYHSSAKTYSAPNLDLYVMKPDKSSVAHGADLISRVLNGQVITDADLTVPKK